MWAILQPFITMLVFTFIFNRVAGVKSDGPPYPLFAYAGLAPWIFFSTSVTQSSNSLIANQQLVSKVYFPACFHTAGGNRGAHAGPIALTEPVWPNDGLLSLAIDGEYRVAAGFHAGGSAHGGGSGIDAFGA